MATLITPKIFKPYGEIRAAMTLRGKSSLPYGLNFSQAVGDDPERVEANRRGVARQLGFLPEDLAWQQQVHGDRIVRVEEAYLPGESDALVTDRPGRLLAASVADCVPVLIYAPERRVVAAVHSGWRGSAQNIVGKTIEFLRTEFDARPEELRLWIGPSAGACCYEVGEDVVEAFDRRHSRSIGEGKHLFDNRGAILSQLQEANVPPVNLDLDPRCTICDERFHSFRRDGKTSGRMWAMIGMLAAPGA